MNEKPKEGLSLIEEEKDTNTTKKKTGKSHFFLGATLGAAAGTIAGILFAPKSGEETREELAASGRKAKRNLRDRVRRYKESKKPYVQKRITAGKILEEDNAKNANEEEY